MGSKSPTSASPFCTACGPVGGQRRPGSPHGAFRGSVAPQDGGLAKGAGRGTDPLASATPVTLAERSVQAWHWHAARRPASPAGLALGCRGVLWWRFPCGPGPRVCMGEEGRRHPARNLCRSLDSPHATGLIGRALRTTASLGLGAPYVSLDWIAHCRRCASGGARRRPRCPSVVELPQVRRRLNWRVARPTTMPRRALRCRKASGLFFGSGSVQIFRPPHLSTRPETSARRDPQQVQEKAALPHLAVEVAREAAALRQQPCVGERTLRGGERREHPRRRDVGARPEVRGEVADGCERRQAGGRRFACPCTMLSEVFRGFVLIRTQVARGFEVVCMCVGRPSLTEFCRLWVCASWRNSLGIIGASLLGLGRKWPCRHSEPRRTWLGYVCAASASNIRCSCDFGNSGFRIDPEFQKRRIF